MKNGTGIIGGEITERSMFKNQVHSIEGIGDIAQLIPVGPRAMGMETEVYAGSEWIVALQRKLVINITKD
ncbi:MAG: hypothetical protein MZU91_05875 [Desulfosudis oleivorans]|nr:hypothetical protein [Desulfosudis oleivorans]